MNETLKAAGNLGAELGAAKAEIERLRGLLRESEPYITARAVGPMETSYLLQRVRAALSKQAEPQSSCKWTRDEDTGAYGTACGVTWHLIDGGEPEEHGQYYCHHCGKQIDDEGADHE